MVGICSVFGDRGHDISSLDTVDSALCLTGDERREEYRTDGSDVVVASHPFFAGFLFGIDAGGKTGVPTARD